MLRRIICLLIFCLCGSLFYSRGQSPAINPRWLHGYWTAKWISERADGGSAFGVYHFRKGFQLDRRPDSFVVHVSADNRYRLFVNGRSVSTGPARSDLANWNFETVDLAPFLQPGFNVIAATVWNFADYRPYAQISFQTAFILQGNSSAEEIVNTNSSWKSRCDSSYSPLLMDKARLQTYIVTADGERVDGNKYVWGFEKKEYDDSRWSQAAVLWYAAKSRTYGTDGNWMLVPRTIPPVEESAQRFSSVRRSTLEGMVTSDFRRFLSGASPLRIPQNSSVQILFDQSCLTNAYPQLKVSQGRNAIMRLSYAEALIGENRSKGNRDSVEGKKLIGLADEYKADGGKSRIYSPLFFRTFRYLQLDIETREEPLIIEDFQSVFTGYPFQQNAYFKSDAPDLQQIWETGWRTARLCAVETYFDCPYYEQLQYVGDTRIQALISLYVSGDDRLMKKAIDDIGHSFIADGLTQSRYPCRDMQVIPTFSLWWVCMIHDFWMHRTDDGFVRSHLDEMQEVLQWYRERLTSNGMLGPLSWWQFVDWSWPWVDSIRVGGVPPGASMGGSSIITLQYVYTLKRSAELLSYYGRNAQAEEYRKLADTLARETYRLCWDPDKGMLADTYMRKEFSQHANIMAVLTDAIPISDQRHVLERVIGNKQITPCTYYFTFYLFEALKKTGLAGRFFELLEPWRAMLQNGLTTFAENPEPTRSDCHAWSASPDYELLSLVCGIKPASPGFKEVLIEPHPGYLNSVEGRVPHPEGYISVSIKQNSGHVEARVELPPGVKGKFRWKNKDIPLHGGSQSFPLSE